MAALAFVQVSIFLCSMTQLAWHYWPLYPYKLFTLLDDAVKHAVAQDFLDQPECMLDEFSRRFRELFPCVEQLLSDKVRGILVALGLLVRLSIARVECRRKGRAAVVLPVSARIRAERIAIVSEPVVFVDPIGEVTIDALTSWDESEDQSATTKNHTYPSDLPIHNK